MAVCSPKIQAKLSSVVLKSPVNIKSPWEGTPHSEKVDLHFDFQDPELIECLLLRCYSCPPVLGKDHEHAMQLLPPWSSVSQCHLPPLIYVDLSFSGKRALVVLARLGTKSQNPFKQEIFCKI